jgi:ribonuclease PH
MKTSRPASVLRPVTIEPFPPSALRSRKASRPKAAPPAWLITQGQTRVLCTASLAKELPAWLAPPRGEAPQRGWVTAEYAMLPGASPQRIKRGPSSRATEIQRLIGRVLRSAVDLTKMPGLTVTCDCDVLTADGGTRTAAITGAYVALADALGQARRDGLVSSDPLRGRGPVAAVSVGIIDSRPRLDLDYALDSRAEVDLNVAMNARGQFIDIQGTAEGRPFSRSQLDQLLRPAAKGIRQLIAVQRRALRQCNR